MESRQCLMSRDLGLHAPLVRPQSRGPAELMRRQDSGGHAPYQHLGKDFCHSKEEGGPSLCLHPVLLSLSDTDFFVGPGFPSQLTAWGDISLTSVLPSMLYQSAWATITKQHRLGP